MLAPEDDEIENILPTDSVEVKSQQQSSPQNQNQPQLNNFGITDQLSELFSIIGSVCSEQFTIIRLIFPKHSIARITRLLIQRIFNDPAFGIQSRVDNVLNPKNSKLLLSEYLNALIIVKQKLTALYYILLEFCIQPDFLIINTTEDDFNSNNSNSNNNTVKLSEKLINNNNINVMNIDDDDEDERIKSESQVKEFLEEQVNVVTSTQSNENVCISSLFLFTCTCKFNLFKDSNFLLSFYLLHSFHFKLFVSFLFICMYVFNR